MPFDSGGNFSLVSSYLAVTGQTIQPVQHNPPFEDVALNGLSQVLVRDGRAPMTGNLNMGTFQAKNMADGALSTDGVTKNQLDTQIATRVWELIQSSTPSAVTTFAAINLSAFRTIRVSGYVTLATAGGFTLRTSSNNGSSYDSGVTDYTNTLQNTSGGTVSSAVASGSSIILTTTGGLDAGSFVRFDVIMEGFNKAQNLRTRMNSEGINGAALLMSMAAGSRAQATARNAFQIQSAAAFTGWIVIEGIRG